MKARSIFVENSQQQRLTNTQGKVSTQFTSRELKSENLSKKKAIEESVKMEGYEVNFRKRVSRSEKQQPMTGYSEFWIS